MSCVAQFRIFEYNHGGLGIKLVPYDHEGIIKLYTRMNKIIVQIMPCLSLLWIQEQIKKISSLYLFMKPRVICHKPKLNISISKCMNVHVHLMFIFLT